MSFEASAWALKQKAGGPAPKGLLMQLAHRAHDSGECYPGIDRLSVETEQSVDTVRRNLKILESRGLIARCSRWHESGRRMSDYIVLLMDESCVKFAVDHGWDASKATAEDGDTGAPTGDAQERDCPADSSAPASPESAPPTLANCGGDPSKLCEGDPSKLRGSIYGRNDQVNDQSLSGAGAAGEREKAFQAEWRAFHDLWNWQETESPIVARGVFRQLSEADRALARRWAKTYLDECGAKKRRQAYCGNWLRNRGWEEYLDRAGQVAERKAELHRLQIEKYGGIVIREGSPQFAAWARYEREHNGLQRIATQRFPTGYGIVRPTEWPPPASARASPDAAA